MFALWEKQKYSDRHNCSSDLELKYNSMVQEHEHDRIFTYINEDYHFPFPKMNIPAELSACMSKLSLNAVVASDDTNSMGRLFKSEENVMNPNEQWTAMHVVFDNANYDEDSELLLNQESLLLSIFYNIKSDYIIVSPDTNHLELNPYRVESETGVMLGYQYAVELEGVFEEWRGEELMVLLRKLHKKWEKKQQHLINFVMPPLGKKLYLLTMEIVSATDFDEGYMYVEYNMHVPEELNCSDALHGSTHTSQPMRVTDKHRWNYGHCIDLMMEGSLAVETPTLKIFFEVISVDSWGRYRTEGYAYLPLVLEPGRFTKSLGCSRPEELDIAEADSRRFFVGGCHLIKDLEVLVKPQLKNADFRFVSTGSLYVRWNVISQTQTATTIKPPQPGTSTASALLQGAEVALRKYKKARARLAAATKDLCEPGDG